MQSFAVGLIFEKIIFITRLVQIGINRAMQDAFFSRVVTGIINYRKAITFAKTKLFLRYRLNKCSYKSGPGSRRQSVSATEINCEILAGPEAVSFIDENWLLTSQKNKKIIAFYKDQKFIRLASRLQKDKLSNGKLLCRQVHLQQQMQIDRNVDDYMFFQHYRQLV